MSNLASAYKSQGKYSDAEALFKPCLDKMKVVLGESNPNTLNTMNSLADVCDLQGKHSDAEVLFKRCLAKRKVVLGENHPDTLRTMNNLAHLYNHSAENL